MDNSVGGILRYWRRRRSVSQMQLALECDTSSRHLSCVETGRAQASKPLLLRLSEVLDIPLRLRNHLLVAAGYTVFYPETGLSEPEMQQANWMLEKILLSHQPYPAMLLDRNFNILRHNDSFDRLARYFVSDTCLCLNKSLGICLRLLFDPRGWAEQVDNLAEVFQVNMSRAERILGLDPSNQELEQLIQEVAQLRPQDYQNWQGSDQVQIPQLILSVRYSKGRLRGRLAHHRSDLGWAPQNVYLQELQIESGYPSNAESEAFFVARPEPNNAV